VAVRESYELHLMNPIQMISWVAKKSGASYLGAALEVLRAPRHPYTEGLLRAAPKLVREKLVPIPGNVPPLDALPKGCAFAPRCSYRIAECDVAVPDLRTVNPAHAARCILASADGIGERLPEMATR